MKPRVAMPLPHSSRTEYNERSTHWYVEALAAVGIETVLISPIPDPSEILRCVADCSGVLLPGSPADVPPQKYGAEKQSETNPADAQRDNLDELLIQDSYNLYKPLFAICYGMQTLNVWRTGSLIQHLPTGLTDHAAGSKVLRAHSIEIASGSKLAQLAGASREWVNSSHHQALDRVGDGLTVTARSSADNVIEAVEGTRAGHWVLGVQWHPERTFASERLSRAMFEEFAREVRSWKPRKVYESVVAFY